MQEQAALPSGEEVRRALERVLARPDFARAEPPPFAAFWKAVSQAVKDFFHTLDDAMHHVLGSSSETVVGIVLLVVLAALLAHLAWSVLQLRVQGEADVLQLPDSGPSSGAGERERAGLAEAGRLAAAGAFAEAMHALYHGVVLWLDRRGHVRHERFKTGAEYAADLKPALRPPFRALLRHYYPMAFGGRPAGEAEWLAMRRAASDLGVPS